MESGEGEEEQCQRRKWVRGGAGGGQGDEGEDGDQQTHQVLLRGGGTHVTSELCKVAAWERRGVCVSVCAAACVGGRKRQRAK